MQIKVKNTPSLDRVPFEVKKHIAEYLPRESLICFSQTNHLHHQVADSPIWKVYLKAPPDECGSYRELFLDPSQRKPEFVTADRIGKDFIARFKDGILCIDPETQTISLEQEKTHYRSIKEKITQQSYFGMHEWKVQDTPFIEKDSYLNRYPDSARRERVTEKLVIDLSHVNEKIPDAHGYQKTPLGLCCERGFLIAVQFLLTHPNIQMDKTGLDTMMGQVLWGGDSRNSLIIAIEHRHIKCVELVLKHFGHKFSPHELTMLWEAAEYFHLEEIKPLLTKIYWTNQHKSSLSH